MTHAAVQSLREFARRAEYAELVRENRHLRMRLGDLIGLADGWYYGPLFETRAVYSFEEPCELARARGTLGGDLRKVPWIKFSVAQSMQLKRLTRKTRSRVIHAIFGVWILGLGIIAANVGTATGWWAPDHTFTAMLAAFGGWMAGGRSMWSRLHFRRFGINL